MKESYDVIVVGVGVAGATLAYELAKRGIGVLVLEKEKLPRYKCCAGGVTSKAAKLLDFDISEVAEDVIHKVSFTFNLGSPYLGQHSQPLIYTVMRDTFDHFLVQRAQQLGAVLRDGQKVTRIQASGDWIEVSTGDNIFRSRIVAGADGAYSVVARELGMKRRIEYIAGIESEVVVSEEELAKWKSLVQIDLGCILGGYGWVFPKRNHLSIGAGCLASKARHLDRLHRKFLNLLSMGNYTIARSSSHLIPTCTKGMVIWQDKALLLGDAAGLADPLTGEGIYNAILSARLAAPVIENSLMRGKVGLQDYQEAIEEKIMSELRIARTLSKFFIRFPHLAFRMLNQREGVWRTGCYLVLGETDYAAIKESKGGFKGILNRLFRA
ncbi:MAG: NAD(P)/FAD-dependent oxidoreductase [Chloroflexi bacterium]|nr:NAD(P)/FAD-dependent oxidoreductase [Chloroflexota bacterium]